MTKKNYEALAEAIKSVPRTSVSNRAIDNVMYRAGQDSIIRSLIVVLAEDNPRFDTGRFLEACGRDHD